MLKANRLWVHVRGRARGGRRAVMRTSGSGLFPKSPSVDTHSSVTLQQTYYLPFCHLVFPFHTQGKIPFQQRRRLPLARAEWVWPFREKMLHFTGKSANLKQKPLGTRPPLWKAPLLQQIKASLQTHTNAHCRCPTFRGSLNSPGYTVRKV